MPDVIQVIPQPDFTVYVYFSDGTIKQYDMTPFLNKGVFKKISEVTSFMEKCTVMNHTLAWDLSGIYDPYNCIDIAPETIYKIGKTVIEPIANS
jgi:hypothetical protein